MRYVAIMICMLLAVLQAAIAADTKAEDIVAQHLDSIGTEEARAAIKSLAVQGSLRFKILAGGAADTPGNWQRLSEERKSKFVMRFGDQMWWGEQFVFDGAKACFAAATLSHHWSVLGSFVLGQESIVEEGLLGGVLGTAWALENIELHQAKLENRGRKKIDGQELDEIDYLSKNNSGMKVKLYFDPLTHHHVMTVYTLARVPTIVHNSLTNAHQKENRYTLEERFSDFQTDKNITLPRQYDLRFTQQLQNGSTAVYDWAMTADKVLLNPDIPPANFQVK
jgi:hypothetical protein